MRTHIQHATSTSEALPIVYYAVYVSSYYYICVLLYLKLGHIGGFRDKVARLLLLLLPSLFLGLLGELIADRYCERPLDSLQREV